jgi:hypothetical protein
MKQQGLSDADIEKLYQDTRLAFLSKDPNTIPDV